jgi:hypothetical protein
MSSRAKLSARVIGVITIGLGVLILLTLASSLAAISKHPEAQLPGGFHGPGLALQRARNQTEANQAIEIQGLLLGATTKEERMAAGKAALAKTVHADNVVVIPTYVIALGLLCLWLTIQSPKGQRWPTAAAILSVIAAGIADLFENKNILDFLNEKTTKVDGINIASTFKWAFLFLVLALLSRRFSTIKDSLIRPINYFLIAVAALGAMGLLALRVAVEWSFWLMALSLILVGILLLFIPKRFTSTP